MTPVKIVKLLLTGTLLLSPVSAQFGVGVNRKKKGSTFEDLNELAKQVGAGGEGLGDFDLGDLDMNAYIQEVMNDPEYKKMMAESGMSEAEIMQSVQDAMRLFQDPDALAAEVQKNMDALKESGGIDSVLENSEAILQQWEQMGVMTKEQIQQLRENPKELERQIRQAFAEISDVFSNPEKIKQMKEFLDPDHLKKQLGQIDFDQLFENEEMMEQARLQLLDPDNPLSAILGDSVEVKEMLSNPAKFKEAMREGIGALKGDGILGTGVGATGGEL